MNRHDNIGFEVMLNLGTLGNVNQGAAAWVTRLCVVVDAPTVGEDGVDTAGKVVADYIRKQTDVCPYLNLGGGELAAERVGNWLSQVADAVEADLIPLWGFFGAEFQHENYEGKLDKAVLRIQPHWHQF